MPIFKTLPSLFKRPAFSALCCQILAVAAIAAFGIFNNRILIQFVHLNLSMTGVSVIGGLLAAVFGYLLGLTRWWWIAINFAFLPLVTLGTGVGISRWVFFGGFALLLALNWNSFRDRVPLYLTSDRGYEALHGFLSTLSAGDFRFIDLGCGFSGALSYLSRRFIDARFEGVETAPMVFLVSWFRSLMGKFKVRYCDIWKTDLSQYDVVYCFLSPVPMPELWIKAQREMTRGSHLVSNTFVIPGVKPDRVIELNDWRKSSIYVYKIG